MRVPILVSVIALTAISMSAQTINITGKVTNQSGRAIAGATVTLPSKNLSATTDASGSYALRGAVAVAPRMTAAGFEGVSFGNGAIIVTSMHASPLRIDLFDIQGNRLVRVAEKAAIVGTHRFALRDYLHGATMTIVRVSIGQQTSLLRVVPASDGKRTMTAAVSSGEGSVVLQAISDTIVASASRYTTKKVAITSYEGTVDITLDTANCTATPSVRANVTVSGSGPHKVVVETNPDAGIKCGTIYRPEDIGPGKKYPIFVWGEGGCSQDGLSNRAAMGEIASWGYFIVADGTPNGTNSCQGGQDGKAFLNYITWAIAQNSNPCSAYYQSLDVTKIAADGFSCGGLMAMNVSGDSRFTAIGYTSSGLFSADNNLYSKIHTPIKIMNGGSSDIAYENGLRDYNSISALGKPIIYFSKTSAGHGGDLGNAKGDFNTVNLAWLNWQLKGDTGATGKGLLMGPSCKYCNASGWVFKSANIQ